MLKEKKIMYSVEVNKFFKISSHIRKERCLLYHRFLSRKAHGYGTALGRDIA